MSTSLSNYGGSDGYKFYEGTSSPIPNQVIIESDSVTEGTTNLYFTNARARSAISASGALSYDSATGAVSYTEATHGLNDLTDVNTSGAADGKILKHNGTSWVIGTDDDPAPVTLTGTPDYITISGQEITRNQIDLTADVTGSLPDSNIASASTWNDKQAALTHGIANTNTVKIDSTTVADEEYARFTANGLESRTGNEVLSDIGASASGHTHDYAATGANDDITSLTGLTTDLAITHGGTGQSTAQAAIDSLSAVSGATNEHVLTKDTSTGNAIWKASAGGGASALDDLTDVNIGSVGASEDNYVLKYDHDNTEWIAAVDSTSSGSGGATVAGDTGEIQYNSAGSLAASSNLSWDNSNIRLGIGGAPTSSLLELYGASSEDAIKIVDSTNSYATTIGQGDSYTNIFGDSSNTGMLLGFGTPTTGNAKVTITAAGNVGIGTNAPAVGYALDIEGATYSRGSGASAAAHINLALLNNADDDSFYISNIGVSQKSKLSLSDQVYIEESTGNVGIGTADPAAKVEARGSLFLTTNSTTADEGQSVYFQTTTSGWNTAQAHGAISGKRTDGSNGYLTFSTRGSEIVAERMRIDSAGQSTFTRTTRGSNIKLELADDGALTGPLLTFYRNSASPADDDDLGKINFSGNNDAAAEVSFAYIECEAKDVSDGSQDGDLIFATVKDGGGAERMRIDASGNVGIGTVSETLSLPLEVRSEAAVGNGTDGVKLSYSTGNSTGVIDTGYSSTGLELRISNSPAMRIDSGGNVGIGVIPNNYGPNYKGLTLNGPDEGGTLLDMEVNTALVFELYASSGEVRHNAVTAVPQTFYTFNKERMRIGSQTALTNTATSSGTGNKDIASTAHGLSVGQAVSLPSGDLGAIENFTVATVTDVDNFVVDLSLTNSITDEQGYGDTDLLTVHNGDSKRKLTLDSLGNVGIATADIDGSLDIGFNAGAGTDPYRGGFYFKNSHDTANPNRRVKFDQTTATAFTIQTVETDETTASDGKLLLQPDGGNVGIGGTPATKLQIIGGHVAVDNEMAYQTFTNSGTRRNLISADSSDVITIGDTSPSGDFGKMTIDSSGNVVMPTDTSDTTKSIRIGSASGDAGWSIGNGLTSAEHLFQVYDNTAGAARLSIDSSGRVTVKKSSNAEVVDQASGTCDLSTSNNFQVTTAAATTINLTNPTDGQSGVIKIVNGGAHAVSFTSSQIKWVGGTDPTPSTASGDIDLIAYYVDGDIYGSYLKGMAY